MLIVGFRSRRSKPEMKEAVLPARPAARAAQYRHRGIATGATLALLLFLLVSDLLANQHLNEIHQDNPLSIQLIGHQWWWEVIYMIRKQAIRCRPRTNWRFRSAARCCLNFSRVDVIHSFWIPELNGKNDLIPGHFDHRWIKADRPGIYRRPMRGILRISTRTYGIASHRCIRRRIQKWIRRSVRTRRLPENDRSGAGRQFSSINCPLMCHTIDGTAARLHGGPEPLAISPRRMTLAAGIIPNNADISPLGSSTRRHQARTMMPPQSA